MISTIASPIDSSGRSRRQVEAELRRPRLEWDSLSRCMIPVALPNDREPRELARGAVMLSGPWSMRGDLHEQRESDRHERLRRGVLGALGFYDYERPNFEAPAYGRRRERAERLMCIGVGGWSASDYAAMAAPMRQPWQFTSAGRYYDAAYGVTLDGGSLVDTWANQGADGATYDAANASSVLTVTSSWSGALSAITGTSAANSLLTCGGTAAQWRIHNAGPWTVIVVAQCTDLSANRTFWANKDSNSTTLKGVWAGYAPGTGYRMFRSGNGAASVHNPADETALGDAVTGAFVHGIRVGSGAYTIAERRAGISNAYGAAEVASPSDTDSTTAVKLFAEGGGGTDNPLVGHGALFIFHQLNSAGYLQSTVDHGRSLARI